MNTKKATFTFVFSILIAITIAALALSCQKAEEPKEEKAPQVEKQAIAPSEPEAESKPEAPIPAEVKEKPSAASQAQTGEKEKPFSKAEEVSPPQKPEKAAEEYLVESPLTEEEQRFLWKFDTGPLMTPNVFGSQREAIRYLRTLLKGDHKNVVPFDPATENYRNAPDSGQRQIHAEIICSAIDALVSKQDDAKETNAEAVDVVVKVLQTKEEYPQAYACASKFLGWYLVRDGEKERIEEVMPLLRKALKYKGPNVRFDTYQATVRNHPFKVRLEAAGTLLAAGEADIALPVLDELAKHGDWKALAQLFEPDKEGVVRWSSLKFWDNRGLEIVKKALDYPSKEVRGWAAIALASLDIEKEKAEETALNIVKDLMYKTKRDYGIGEREMPGKTYTKEYVLPEYKGKNLDELRGTRSSDSRGCSSAMSALGRLKSKEAVPLLRYIKENHTGSGHVCWDVNAESALEMILEDGGSQ